MHRIQNSVVRGYFFSQADIVSRRTELIAVRTLKTFFGFLQFASLEMLSIERYRF